MYLHRVSSIISMKSSQTFVKRTDVPFCRINYNLNINNLFMWMDFITILLRGKWFTIVPRFQIRWLFRMKGARTVTPAYRQVAARQTYVRKRVRERDGDGDVPPSPPRVRHARFDGETENQSSVTRRSWWSCYISLFANYRIRSRFQIYVNLLWSFRL